MKMNDKMKVIVCGGLAIVLCLISYSCGSKETNEQVEPETKQEMQIEKEEELETQEVEETEIQDESLNKQARNGEYKFETEEKNNLELARQFVENVAEKSMSDARYEIVVDEESNTVMHILHLDIDVITNSIHTSQWDELVDNAMLTSSKGKEALETYGITDVNYAFVIGDLDEDSNFILAMNGKLLYNAKDKLN